MAGIVIYQPTRDLYNGVIRATGGVGSGIAAQKTGYHDSRNNNPPGNYSVVLPLDRWGQGPSDGAAAIDITLSDAKMIKFTKMLMAGLDRKDPRLKGIKEVIGTRDGRNVVRYTRNSPTSAPVWAGSDSSHLWHIHISLFRAYINNWSVLKGIVDFLNGVAGTSSSGSKGIFAVLGLKRGDKGEEVRLLQVMLTTSGFPCGAIDGVYGPSVSAAVVKMRRANGSSVTADQGMNPWAVDQLLRAHAWKFSKG